MKLFGSVPANRRRATLAVGLAAFAVVCVASGLTAMATRGHLGGLARTTAEAATVLDAAGYDVVMIETVGVGQDEVDIVRTADVSIVTIVPGSGDEVQALKAGIMRTRGRSSKSATKCTLEA